MLRSILYTLTAALLSACAGGAVVFAPTPLPPDASPLTYTHPSGAFSLVVPRLWASYEQLTAPLAVASFAPPNSPPLLTAIALKLSAPIDLEAAIDQYQSQLRPDLARYSEQARQREPDGTWRVVGLRQVAEGRAQSINTFFIAQDTTLALLEVVVPDDPSLQAALRDSVNSFRLMPRPLLPDVPLTALVRWASAPLEIINLSTWMTSQGVFYVSGEVANRTPQLMRNVAVRAVLEGDGVLPQEARDEVMGYAIPPEGFAPFSLRFGQGTRGAQAFSLSLFAPPPDPALPSVIGAEALRWEDASQTAQDGALFITGRVINEGAPLLRQALAVATVFSPEGRVVGAGFAPVSPDLLAQGQEGQFTILISELGGVADRYIVNVQGLP
ncbi:MAG: hypothetical protein RML73_00875 [Anaerolineae bacterium]|nr:hypothetical protein [Anaerolineae bacterium]